MAVNMVLFCIGAVFLLSLNSGYCHPAQFVSNIKAKSGPPRGYIHCTPDSLKYEILNSEVIALMIDQNSFGGQRAFVKSVNIGRLTNAAATCQAKPLPRGPVTAQTALSSWEIVFGTSECGTTASTSIDGLPMYSNTAYLTVRLDHPLIIRELHVAVPFSCVAEPEQFSSTQLAVVTIIHVTKPIPGSFGIPLSIESKSIQKPFETNIDVQVFEITAKVHADQISNYMVMVDRCWVTPTKAADDALSYTVIANKCAVDPFTSITKANEDEVVIETVALRFYEGPAQNVWFHCKFNVCSRQGDKTACSKCGSRTQIFRAQPSDAGVVQPEFEPLVLEGPAPRIIRNGVTSPLNVG